MALQGMELQEKDAKKKLKVLRIQETCLEGTHCQKMPVNSRR